MRTHTKKNLVILTIIAIGLLFSQISGNNAHAHSGHITDSGIEGHTHWQELIMLAIAYLAIITGGFAIKNTLRKVLRKIRSPQ